MALSLLDLCRMTGRSIWSSGVRSGLTTLGVFMGVAAVSATLNIASIADAQIEQKLAERDKPYLTPWLDPPEGFFEAITDDDAVALKRSIPEIRSLSSVNTLWNIQSVQQDGRDVKDIRTVCVSQNYMTTTGRRMQQGRFFDQADFEQYRPVTVIDQQLAQVMFPDQSPINQAIYAAGMRLTIIGVVESKSSGREFDRTVGLVWLARPFCKVLAPDIWTSLQISPYQLEQMPVLSQKVQKVLKQRHPKAAVIIRENSKDLLKERELQKTSAQALAVVGLIALLIGGVGIANITIAAVMERIKEIGLRRALGATQLEIMLQFILEAVMLSLIGGISAIVTVHLLTSLATTTLIRAPYSFSARNALLSMAAAIGVGVGSSFLPALRATKIDVVQALRGE